MAARSAAAIVSARVLSDIGSSYRIFFPNADWTSSTAKAVEQLHDEVGLAVVEAAPDRRTDPGRHGGIDRIEIEAHVQVVRPIRQSGQGLLHYTMDSMPVDVGHRVHLDPSLLEQVLLAVVEAPDPDEHHVGRVDLRGASADAGELRWAVTEQRGDGHPVDVAGWGGIGGIDVAVGVHPEQSDFLLCPAGNGGDPGDGSGGNGVVSAEDEREVSAADDFLDFPAHHARGAGNLGEVAGACVADLELFHVLDVNVSANSAASAKTPTIGGTLDRLLIDSSVRGAVNILRAVRG